MGWDGIEGRGVLVVDDCWNGVTRYVYMYMSVYNYPVRLVHCNPKEQCICVANVVTRSSSSSQTAPPPPT